MRASCCVSHSACKAPLVAFHFLAVPLKSSPPMINSFLVPPKTEITAKGDGAALDVGAAANRVFLLTLNITRIVEQESLDVSIWGSADGAAWGDKPLITFPQKFYVSE